MINLQIPTIKIPKTIPILVYSKIIFQFLPWFCKLHIFLLINSFSSLKWIIIGFCWLQPKKSNKIRYKNWVLGNRPSERMCYLDLVFGWEEVTIVRVLDEKTATRDLSWMKAGLISWARLLTCSHVPTQGGLPQGLGVSLKGCIHGDKECQTVGWSIWSCRC